MPNIEELQRLQFEDFALENTRRGKLTVLGEHAFGAEQGRIVTAPVTAESSGGGGGGGGTTPPEEKTGACCIDGTCSIMTAADCGSAGGVYQGDNSVCDPNPCPSACDPPWCALCEVTIQAIISGSLFHKDDGCGGGAEFPISGESETATCDTPTECVGSCGTEPTALVYTCDGSCPPESEHTFTVDAFLGCPDVEGGDWFITLNIDFAPDREICGRDNIGLGGDLAYEINIGPDPTGTHTLSFDDANIGSVHYDVIVTVTGC